MGQYCDIHQIQDFCYNVNGEYYVAGRVRYGGKIFGRRLLFECYLLLYFGHRRFSKNGSLLPKENTPRVRRSGGQLMYSGRLGAFCHHDKVDPHDALCHSIRCD